MVLITPVEETAAERAGIIDGVEPFRKLGLIFQRLEVGLPGMGLSFEVCGRLWDLTTPRSASIRAAALAFLRCPATHAREGARPKAVSWRRAGSVGRAAQHVWPWRQKTGL